MGGLIATSSADLWYNFRHKGFPMNNGFDQYYDEATEPGKRERAQAWATAIGLQDVDGLKPSRHLYETARRHIEGEITIDEVIRIIDEYYESSHAESAVSKLHRRPRKLDINGKKLDIGHKKLDIDGLSAPTQVNIKKLREAFAKVEFFKRADALKVLKLTPTAVSNLLSRMNQLGLIVPVSGRGKGAWRLAGKV